MLRNYKNKAILVCNLQTKTVKNLRYRDQVIGNVNKLLYFFDQDPHTKLIANAEFIPEKLGKIDKQVILPLNTYTYRKDTYSMLNDDLVNQFIEKEIEEIILTGMETHWCINSTVIDLNLYNISTYVPVDAIGNSLSWTRNTFNLVNLQHNGAKLCTTDGIISQSLYSAEDDMSKSYVEILKKSSNE